MNNLNTTTYEQQSHETAENLVKQKKSLMDECCLIGFNIQSSSGERTLPNARVEVDGSMCSSNKVKGSKLQWFPGNKLSITARYKQRLMRALSSVGVKYGDLTVVPKTELLDLQNLFDEVFKDWQDDVGDLITNYHSILDDYKFENQDIAQLIGKYALDEVAFKSCFKLTFLPPLAIKPLCASDEKLIEEQVTLSLWEEIAKEGQAIYKSSWFKDKKPVTRVSQKIRSSFRRMMNKMWSLAFLDEQFKEVTKTFKDVLDNLPQNGYIEGHDFYQLTNWIHVCTDVEKLKMHAAGVNVYTYKKEISDVKTIASQPLDLPLVSPIESNEVSLKSSENIVSKPLIPIKPVVEKTFKEIPAVRTQDLGFGVW